MIVKSIFILFLLVVGSLQTGYRVESSNYRIEASKVLALWQSADRFCVGKYRGSVHSLFHDHELAEDYHPVLKRECGKITMLYYCVKGSWYEANEVADMIMDRADEVIAFKISQDNCNKLSNIVEEYQDKVGTFLKELRDSNNNNLNFSKYQEHESVMSVDSDDQESDIGSESFNNDSYTKSDDDKCIDVVRNVYDHVTLSSNGKMTFRIPEEFKDRRIALYVKDERNFLYENGKLCEKLKKGWGDPFVIDNNCKEISFDCPYSQAFLYGAITHVKFIVQQQQKQKAVESSELVVAEQESMVQQRKENKVGELLEVKKAIDDFYPCVV